MADRSPAPSRSCRSLSAFLLPLVLLAAFSGAAVLAGPTASPVPQKPKIPATEKNSGNDLPVIDLEGYKNLLVQHRGKPVAVSFWATWCEPCRDEFPLVNELARKFMPQGIDFIGVSLDDEADRNVARQFLADMKPVFPSYRKKPGNEEQFIAAVNPKWSGSIPATCLYNREGRLVREWIGVSSRLRFDEALEDLLKASGK